MEQKLLYTLVGVSIFFCMMSGCFSCRTYTKINNNNETTIKIQDSLINIIIDLKKSTYTKKQLDLLFEKQSYYMEKTTLFNMNQIVLTKNRPDQKINEIDQRINEINKKINE